MTTKKVSLTLDEAALEEARQQVGRRGLSEFVNDALKTRLQHDRLRKLLADLEEEHGPIPEDVRERVQREWDEDERLIRRAQRRR